MGQELLEEGEGEGCVLGGLTLIRWFAALLTQTRLLFPWRSRPVPRNKLLADKCAGREVELSEGQRAAVVRASSAPLVVLTGGPGCGKTFATRAIVQLWSGQGKDIRLAAPTGATFHRPVQERTCVQWPRMHGLAGAGWSPTRHKAGSVLPVLGRLWREQAVQKAVGAGAMPAGRAAQRLQEEAGSPKLKGATTLHRLLDYRPRRRREAGPASGVEPSGNDKVMRYFFPGF